MVASINIKKIYNVLLIIMILLISSCGTCLSPEDEAFSIKRIDYTGNQLKINGYYYIVFRADTKDEDQVQIYFFYRNGIIQDEGLNDRKDSLIYESMFIEPIFQKSKKKWKYAWGAFKIEENKIQFETWGPGEGSMPAFNHSGDILNDTTFHITKLTRASGSFIRALDDTYHFKRYSPKPDSTNNFVK
jgi:hypothetical protein